LRDTCSNAADDHPGDPLPLAIDVAGLSGLDADQVRRWVFARCVHEIRCGGAQRPALDAVLPRLGGP
jgi:hypothetical protein